MSQIEQWQLTAEAAEKLRLATVASDRIGMGGVQRAREPVALVA